MEIPIDLETANTYLDAAESLRGFCDSEDRARRAAHSLGKSGRLVLTTAHEGNFSRGGCLIVQSPRSIAEAKRWIQWRGFGERLDGFGVLDRDSCYLAKREISSFKGAFPNFESDMWSDRQMKKC